MLTLVLAALILLLAYFIRGISGFGSGLIAIPLLAHFMPLTFVVPLVLITDFSASLLLSGNIYKSIRWPEIKVLLLPSVIGLLIGVSLLVNLPRQPLLITLGIVIMLFGARNALNLHGEKLVSRWWAAPAGMIGGTISAMFGTGGPPYVIYLSHRLREKSELRATITGLFLIEGATRVTTYLGMGLLQQENIVWSILAALPMMALGLYLGHRVHVGISHALMQRLVGVLLLFSGASLVWRGLGT